MAVITVLDKAVSELIAAGEVIERPSSVIKELVENSIDAGAAHITVEIKNGGTTFMRIVDDGCGMAPEDVPTAFLRHATSKINEKADLDTIRTLGFRGEALASIAAVARVTVLTRRPCDEFGTKYEIAGADAGIPEECGCPDGTTLVIKDLFFNVPARRKFMKRDAAEGNAVSQIIQKIAISHPEIAFRFIRDNKMEFHSDGSGTLLAAIHAVYGRDFARDLLPVEHEQDGISVKGFVIKPLYAKNNRSFQNFFVNSRYVRSRSCMVALESAYENLIMTGKFPACVLMLDMPPHTLDVNIHPAKAEVRFSEEKTVINAIYFAVKNALMKAGLIYEFQAKKPVQDWYQKPEPEYTQQPLVEEPPKPAPPKPAAPPPVQPVLPQASMPFTAPVPPPKPVQSTPEPERTSLFAEKKPPKTPIVSGDLRTQEEMPAPKAQPPAVQMRPAEPPPPPARASEPQEVAEIETEPFPDVKVIGELFANYILAQSGDTMIIIDKHAAHERVIFEKLRRDNCRQYQQMLLEPCRVLLTMDEFSAMEENVPLLDRLGFAFDFSHKPYAVTTAAPIFFDGLNLDEIVQELAHNLFLGKVNPQTHLLDDMLHELACKSAIRANDKNSLQELQALTEQVCRDVNIRHCPHGRPVMFTMSKYNLEKQFRRRV
ncbi:MAG: DNA mismatch repair endonuclease MutL [Oscillospiraceae bacterium]|nr:DNA mismatch repair endonuclease MutL [Oscillospiraceae bacterium]